MHRDMTDAHDRDTIKKKKKNNKAATKGKGEKDPICLVP